jgi:hypothetical protein
MAGRPRNRDSTPERIHQFLIQCVPGIKWHGTEHHTTHESRLVLNERRPEINFAFILGESLDKPNTPELRALYVAPDTSYQGDQLEAETTEECTSST